MNNLTQKNRILLVAFLRAGYEVRVQRKMILSVILFIAAISFNARAQQTNILSKVSPGAIKQDLKSLEQVLNSDGTINQNAKATGSFDVSNYEMTYGENGEPVFSQKAKNSTTTGEGVWSDQFSGPSGANKSVFAVVKDALNNIYVGGEFTAAGGVANTKFIAKWNGTAWSALGTGMSGYVNALAIDGNGNLYAGGNFLTAGGVTVNRIAKWNGSEWSGLGTGMTGSTGYVNALAIDGSGNVYAGGDFTTAGGVTANYIAKWNGSTWSSLGTGMNRLVKSLAIDGSGILYAGGWFTTAGGTTAKYIAKWNGSAWSALGTGTDGEVNAIVIYGSNVYVGGGFVYAGGVGNTRSIAKWNGSAWSALPMSGTTGSVRAIAIDGSGNVYVGGDFPSVGGIDADYIAKWNIGGSGWSAIGTNIIDKPVNALVIDDNGELFVGGSFTRTGKFIENGIVKWNGSEWSTLGTGMNGSVSAIAIDGSGNLYAGGTFKSVGGVIAERIAKWNGSTWSALGSGLNAFVNAIALDGNGNLYAAGWFDTAGGVAANRIAKWNGTAWSALGNGMQENVNAIAIDGSGILYAGGSFTSAGDIAANRIAKWNGSSWSALGSGMNSSVSQITIDSNGNLYAAGWFTTAGGVTANRIAKWNGSAWSALGTGLNDVVYALEIDGNDSVYAGGAFTIAGEVAANRIAKWNGSAWSALGTGMNNIVQGITVDGNGNVYAGGIFTAAGDVAANRISKWNGSAWSVLGAGVDNNVYAIKTYNNIVYCGGDFLYADGVNSAYLGKYTNLISPEIDVKQATTAIADGTGTFGFGSKSTNSNTDIVFTIENTGTAASTLANFSISGANADQFSVPGSTPTTVSAGGTATFTVRFTPVSAGAKTAAVSFTNEDADENPYNFSITGTGVAPIQVDANSSSSTLGLTSDSDVEVAAGVTLIIDANTLINKLILAPTANLTLGSNTLNAANGIVLQSSALGNATILGDNAISNATVEQYVTAGRNWIISSPITNAGYEVLNRGVSIGEWHEATKSWHPKLSGTLTSGKGYVQFANAIQTGTTGTLVFEGNTNAGNIDVSVTSTGSGTLSGYNLIGNPYPSYLNWSDLIADASNANINRSFWYTTQNTVGRYTIVTYNGIGGMSVTGNGTANTAISGIIPPMQGFWVRVNSDTPSTIVRFTNEMRGHRNTNENTFKAPKSDARARLRLQLTNGIQSDETLVYFDVNATNTYDDYDSPKMVNNSVIEPDLYTVAGNERLVINGLKDVTNNLELTLGFNLNTTATMKLKVSELQNFESGTYIYLLDKVENSQTLLNPDTEYDFSTTTTSTYIEDRFSLLFRTQDLNSDIDNAGESSVNVFVDAENQLHITAPINSTYVIYNSVGRKVNEGKTFFTHQTLNLKNQTGMFIVRINSVDREYLSKLIIN
jgi:hypothetical protein